MRTGESRWIGHRPGRIGHDTEHLAVHTIKSLLAQARLPPRRTPVEPGVGTTGLRAGLGDADQPGAGTTRPLLGQGLHKLLAGHPGTLGPLLRARNLHLRLTQDLPPRVQFLLRPRLTRADRSPTAPHPPESTTTVRCLPPRFRDHARNTKKLLLTEQEFRLPQRTQSCDGVAGG
ncbi:hypothetical protein ABZ468_38285 [Streptomyces sp. NPDC005708]|uniref:hypothetical protein n=1 Tax=Streptomyces sp. NPDC005708 TaxID=3154564 RepID=UPI0033D4B337